MTSSIWLTICFLTCLNHLFFLLVHQRDHVTGFMLSEWMWFDHVESISFVMLSEWMWFDHVESINLVMLSEWMWLDHVESICLVMLSERMLSIILNQWVCSCWEFCIGIYLWNWLVCFLMLGWISSFHNHMSNLFYFHKIT